MNCNSIVVTRGKGGRREVENGKKGVKYMVTEDLTLSEHTMQYKGDVL